MALGLAGAVAALGLTSIVIEADLRAPPSRPAGSGRPRGWLLSARGDRSSGSWSRSTRPPDDGGAGGRCRRRAHRTAAGVARGRAHEAARGRACERADVVIFAGAPAGRVGDALPLAKLADRVLLVARLGVTDVDDLREALRRSRARAPGPPASWPRRMRPRPPVDGRPARGWDSVCGGGYARQDTQPPAVTRPRRRRRGCGTQEATTASRNMTMAHDVAVIGAGPYGLACAAHLRGRGLDVYPLGRPMDLWERCMPVGMFLRSSWEASTIADPDGALSLDAYEEAHGLRLPRPIPLDDYLRYARWFQRSAVPDVDPRRVERVEQADGGFELRIEGGDALAARRVVIATGPAGFARRPAAFAGLPEPLACHSSQLRELHGYAGRRTAVIGAGQSAIELAALLHEVGATVEVLARAGDIRWLRRSGWLHGRDGAVRRILYPPTDVGPVGLSWLVAVPDAFRRVPEPLAGRIAYRCIRPAASGWLVARTADVRMTFGRSVASVAVGSSGVRLELDDGAHREVDRVVLATGFDVRADRHPLLAPDLRARLLTRDGMPVLGPGSRRTCPACTSWARSRRAASARSCASCRAHRSPVGRSPSTWTTAAAARPSDASRPRRRRRRCAGAPSSLVRATGRSRWCAVSDGAACRSASSAATSTRSRRRHATRVPRLAWPEGEEARVAYLLDLAEREPLEGWVLIPTHDEEAALFARHHDALTRRYRLTTSPWETLRAAYDKRCTHALAAGAGVAQPWTVFPAGVADLARARDRFPVVVKPAFKATANRLTIDKAWRADDAAALRARYEEACELVDPAILMVQQLVPGDGAAQLSCAALCADGAVLASLAARRARQYPMDFGRASSYVETIDDPSVDRDARRLLRAMPLHGPGRGGVQARPADGREPAARRQPARMGLAVAVRPRRRRLPLAAVADWRAARGAAGARCARRALGAHGDRLSWRSPARSAAGRLSPRTYLRSLRRPLEFAVFARDDPLPVLRRPARHGRATRHPAAGGSRMGRRCERRHVDPFADARWTSWCAARRTAQSSITPLARAASRHLRLPDPGACAWPATTAG